MSGRQVWVGIGKAEFSEAVSEINLRHGVYS